MKNYYPIMISFIITAILLLIITFMPELGKHNLKQNHPIPVILKANTSKPNDFWSVVKKGIREAGHEFGVDFYITGPRQEKDKQMQMDIMNQILERKPPVIILAASDYEKMVPYVVRAQEAGIPVITVDSGIDSTIPISFIATDNLEAGHKAGYALSELLKNSENRRFAIMSYIQGTATAIDREKGTRESTTPLEYVETLYCEGDRDIAYKLTMDLLDRDSDLAGIIALNEPSSIGVAKAIDERGLKDNIMVVGFDNAPSEMQYLEEGVLKAIIIQRPFNMGYLAMKTAYDYLTGRKVESFINTGSVLITADNMYHQELQEVLFPFGD